MTKELFSDIFPYVFLIVVAVLLTIAHIANKMRKYFHTFDEKLIPLGSLVIVESDRSEPRFADITITNLASETLSPFIQSLLSLYGMPGDRVVDPKTQVLHFFIHTKLDKDIHEFVRYKLRNVKNALELYSIKEELEFRDCNPKVASIMVDILRRGGIYTEIDRIGASMQVPIEMKS